MWPHVTPCDPMAPLPSTTSWGLLNLMSIEVGDAICPSHPLLPPSSPAFNLSKHQGLFQWVSSLHSFYGSYFPYSLYEIFFFFLFQHLLYHSGLEWNLNLFLTQHAPSFLLSFIPEFLWFQFFHLDFSSILSSSLFEVHMAILPPLSCLFTFVAN